MIEFQQKAMDMWFRTLPGALLVEKECAELDRLLPMIPGQRALQVGGSNNLQLLKKSQVAHIYHCSEQVSRQSHETGVRCRFDQLPFDSESMDLIILPHTLEFCPQNEKLLAEAYRILVPGGRLIILGFNYWSRWSIICHRRNKKGYPWSGQFYSIWRIKKWLHNIGYSVVSNKTTFFLGALKKRPNKRWSRLSEVLGQVFIPKMGAVYLIHAEKKVAGTTPLVTMWERKRAPIGGSITPTTRTRISE